MWSYFSGSLSRQSSRSCSRTLFHHGLSRQFALTTTAPVGGLPPRNMLSTASVFRFGFHENHNSEPSSRIVGRKRSSELWLKVCASSTHARLNFSSDLIDSSEIGRAHV